MSELLVSASAQAIGAAYVVLDGTHLWPDPSTGLARRIFQRMGVSLPPFMECSLRPTSLNLLRRTPELAAFGYVLDVADAAMVAQWVEAFEHLRGRDIYPADRQSFIFNPVEILGVCAGVSSEAVPAEHRQWFAGVLLRGLADKQFRTPLSVLAAEHAVAYLGRRERQHDAARVGLDTLSSTDVVIAGAISYGFGVHDDDFLVDIERVLIQRILQEPLAIGDAAEAATVAVACRRATDRIILRSTIASAEETIVALCRRFPLLVERLQARQRKRQPIAIADEYDVQDLLHAVLKLHFDDVRAEEWTPSYAGSSSRVDFYLPSARIVVEAKMTRERLTQKDVTNELIIDAARYGKMSNVDTLICLVYDPQRKCTSPTALENDLNSSSGFLKVRAVVCPQGL